MLDSYADCWNRMILRAPDLSPKLAQDFIRNAFRRLAERRRWSWLVKFGQFISPQVYTTGTVNVTQNSTIVMGNGTTFTAAMVGQQFRIGLTAPIYTIAIYDSPTQIELDSPFGGITQSTVGYNIYQCFYPVPPDFHQFITLYDPSFNWNLVLDVNQADLNAFDAQRANTGNAYVVSFRDYTTSQVGIVSSPIQIIGSGAVPTTSGTFTAPASAIYTVIITTGGQSGTAIFEWNKNNGAYTTNVTSDPNGYAQTLMDGINISFPTGVTYNLNDQFIIQGTAISNAGVPRYELYPHQQSNHIYGYLYESRPIDISDTGAVLPRYIRGDVLVEMGLEDLALWPGASPDKPNPYFSARNAAYHGARADRLMEILERQDDEVWVQSISYQYAALGWPMAVPFGDARWLQSHDV